MWRYYELDCHWNREFLRCRRHFEDHLFREPRGRLMVVLMASICRHECRLKYWSFKSVKYLPSYYRSHTASIYENAFVRSRERLGSASGAWAQTPGSRGDSSWLPGWWSRLPPTPTTPGHRRSRGTARNPREMIVCDFYWNKQDNGWCAKR